MYNNCVFCGKEFWSRGIGYTCEECSKYEDYSSYLKDHSEEPVPSESKPF